MTDKSKPRVLGDIAYENLLKCPQTSNTIKQHCITKLRECGDDVSKAQQAYDTFRRPQIRRGQPPSDLLPDEGLGTLVAELPFSRKTAEFLKLSHNAFQRKLAGFLSYEEKRRKDVPFADHERVDALAISTLKVPTRQDGILWLFRNPRRKPNAFDDLLDDGLLPMRLGLILQPGQTRLTFSFKAAHVDDVRKPRFPDATWEYLPYWDWRGRTRPLPIAPAGLLGLEEVVTEPPIIRQINQSVRRITVS